MGFDSIVGGSESVYKTTPFWENFEYGYAQSFFEIGADASYFEGLEIMQEKTLCENYMGKFPVISVSLKDVDGPTYESAVKKMSGIIRREARRLQFLIDSDKLSEVDKDYMKTFAVPISMRRHRRKVSLHFQSCCISTLVRR